MKIPEQIAVTGFNSNPSVVFLSRRLTSVKLKSQQVGAAAIRLLLSRNSKLQLPRQVLKLDCDLIEGDAI